MHADLRSLQQVDKPRIATAKVIDPHRRIDQNLAAINATSGAVRAAWQRPVTRSYLPTSAAVGCVRCVAADGQAHQAPGGLVSTQAV